MNLIKQLSAIVLIIGAQSASALDLIEAYELALGNDPQYRVAIKEYESGANHRLIGKSALLPKISANYEKSANQATQSGAQYSGGPNISNQWSYPSDFAVLQFTQPLLNLEAMARWRQGQAQTDFSNTRFLIASQELLIRVFQTYTDYLHALDQFSFHQAEKDLFGEQLKVAQRLFIKGEGSKVEILEAETGFYQSDAKLLDAIDLIELNKKKLSLLIGRELSDKEKIAPLKANFQPFSSIAKSFTDYQEKFLSSSLELQAASNQIQIAQQEYKKINAGHYPVMNMVAAMTTQKSNTVVSINQTTDRSFIGLQLSIPIYSGGETLSREMQAYSNFEKSKSDYDVIKNKALSELRKEYNLFLTGAQKINSLKKASESAGKLIEVMNRNVQAGERVYLETLLAKKNLTYINRDLYLSQYSYLLAYLRLSHIQGDLTTSDFKYVANFFK